MQKDMQKSWLPYITWSNDIYYEDAQSIPKKIYSPQDAESLGLWTWQVNYFINNSANKGWPVRDANWQCIEQFNFKAELISTKLVKWSINMEK